MIISRINGEVVFEEADVGEAAREAEDLPKLAPWRGEEDAEDPRGEEREHGAEEGAVAAAAAADAGATRHISAAAT